jgi:hypothetical protein
MDFTKIAYHIIKWDLFSNRKKNTTANKKRQSNSKKLEARKVFTIIGKNWKKNIKNSVLSIRKIICI